LIASEFPFARIVGIDLSPNLLEVARRNIALPWPGRRGDDFELLLKDARDYQLPDGDLVVFFYNPFTDDLLRAVLSNLARAMAARPRKVSVIFQNYGASARVIREMTWLERVDEGHINFLLGRWALYR